MFGEIARFLLNTLFTLFGAALLLRAWMQVVRMPPYNPVSNAVMQATNWLVLPLGQICPGGKNIAWGSVCHPDAFAGGRRSRRPRGPAAHAACGRGDHRHQMGAESHHLDDDPDGVAVLVESAILRLAVHYYVQRA